MAWRAPGSLSSSLSPKGFLWRVGGFFLGDSVRLRLLSDLRLEDLRFEVGGPIFSLVGVVVLAGDLDVVDVVASDVLCVVVALAVGWGFALGFAIEADLELMNPASVG